MLGQSAGGIIAILMFNQGLFAPLLVGSGIMFCASCLAFRFLIEPGKLKITSGFNELNEDLDKFPSLSHDKVDEDDGKEDYEEEKLEGRMIEMEEEGEVDIREEDFLPSKVDYRTMAIIIAGVFADTIGTKALFPLCVAPLEHMKDFTKILYWKVKCQFFPSMATSG